MQSGGKAILRAFTRTQSKHRVGRQVPPVISHVRGLRNVSENQNADSRICAGSCRTTLFRAHHAETVLETTGISLPTRPARCSWVEQAMRAETTPAIGGIDTTPPRTRTLITFRPSRFVLAYTLLHHGIVRLLQLQVRSRTMAPFPQGEDRPKIQ